MLDALKAWATGLIDSMGYPGVFLLMFLDAMNVPIPSEAIMPMAGILAAEGRMGLPTAIAAGSLGSFSGSLVSYWIGAALGKPFLLKYGKWFFLSPDDVEKGEKWFEKYGLLATLWGRAIPLVRTFVSLPAGLFRANLALFALYAAIGSTVWNGLWGYIGYSMGKNWERLSPYMDIFEKVVIVLLLVLIVRFVVIKVRKRKAKGSEDS